MRLTIYDKHLRRLGIIIVVIRLFMILFFIATTYVFHVNTTEDNVWLVISKAIVSFTSASFAFAASRYRKPVPLFTMIVLLLSIALAVMLIMDKKTTDSLIDITLLMNILLLMVFFQIRKRVLTLQSINRRAPNTLDLRISGHGGLFNPLVIGPHPDPSKEIITVIDHFLQTAPNAPLNLCFHAAKPISPIIQTTFAEVLQLHYQDEIKRVERFLESRYIRYIALIAISVAMLKIMAAFAAIDSNSILWVIFGNFAAFSLWQIGSTYYERAEAFKEMMLKTIASECKIKFY